jgi:uncharacterized protein involved in exopolysaccharide biosynthesis
MPTSNPRINVTLSPSLDAIVVRLSELQRVSKSQVLRELVEAAEPALAQAVDLMEQLRGVNESVRKSFVRSLDVEQAKLEKSQASLLAGMRQASADLVGQVEAVKGRRPARSSAQRRPGGTAPAPSGGGKTPRSLKGGSSRKTRGRKS